MKTATEMREDFIKTRRSQSVKDYLTARNEAQKEKGSFQEKTEYDGFKIGDRFAYSETKPCNGGYTVSRKEGWLFSVGKNCVLVWTSKELVKVSTS